MTVLVVGEALIDLIVSPSGGIEAIAGGGPFNIARTVARLDVPVAFGGGVSDDAFGRRISALLKADGVTVPVATRTGLPTTLALAELDAHGAATYRFYLDGTSAPDVTLDDLPSLDGLRILAVGTLGLVMHPIADTVDSAVAAARSISELRRSREWVAVSAARAPGEERRAAGGGLRAGP